MTISLKKDSICNCMLREVPSEVERKLNLEIEKVCMTLGNSLGPLKTQFPYLKDEGQNQPFSSLINVVMIK